MFPSISLIIATYNWHQSLNLVLKSVLNQSIQPNEILIADDGSTDETKEIIDYFRVKTTIPVKHFWHKDDGFRKTIILNTSLASANSEYIIQADGDCILHQHFIKDHIYFAKKNTFISGSRVFLNKKTSSSILNNIKINLNCFNRNLKNRHYTLRLPFMNSFYKAKKEPVDKLIFKVRGSNMSFWKKDLLDINGYNEDFIGWGIEDSELAYRLFLKGLSLKRIKFVAIQYHLYHHEVNRNSVEKNYSLLEKIRNIKKYKVKNGILKNKDD